MDKAWIIEIFFVVITIICWILTYFFVIKENDKEKRCSFHITGKVAGYSYITYNFFIHLPLVKYSVNGKEYKIVGPKFTGPSSIVFANKFSNPIRNLRMTLASRENLPGLVFGKVYSDNSVPNVKYPLMLLYPIGSDVDVFYNPKNPKEAYVQRFHGGSPRLEIPLIIFSIIFFLISLVFFIALIS